MKHGFRWLLVFAVASTVSGCGAGDPGQSTGTANVNPPGAAGSPTGVPAPVGEPKTAAAAKAKAVTLFRRNAAGDYAGVWDGYTTELQALVSRSDYVRFSKSCTGPDGTGVVAKVTDIRAEGEDYVVTVELLGVAASRTMTYEKGEWRMRPTAEAVAGWKSGVDAYLTKQHREGACLADSN